MPLRRVAFLLVALAVGTAGCRQETGAPEPPRSPPTPVATAPVAPPLQIYFVGLDLSSVPLQPEGKPASINDVADQLVALTQGELLHVSETGFVGITLRMSPEAAAALAKQKEHLGFVRYVEANQPVRSDAQCWQETCETFGLQSQPNWAWGRVRLRHRCLQALAEMTPCTGGPGSHVYVVDSGIDRDHPDFLDIPFGPGFTLIGGDAYDDETGHGTAMAGIVAGHACGVNQGVTLHSCRFIGLDDSGTLVGDVWTARQAIERIRLDHEERAVALMAFSTQSISEALNEDVNGLVEADVAVVASAGNSEWITDPSPSPASAARCLAVGALNWNDRVWDGMVLGEHVKVFAPGVGIPAPLAGTQSYGRGTGTSQAAAHVAGVLARIRGIATAALTAQEGQNRVLTTSSLGLLTPTQLGAAGNRIAHDCYCESY